MAATAWLGSVIGMVLLLVAAAAIDGVPTSELWSIPVIVFGYGSFFAFPVSLLGLLLFGLPLTLALKRWAERPWMALVAIVAGGITGRLFYHLVDHTIFFGNDDLGSWPVANMGLFFGCPTGLIWFMFARRLFRSQRIADAAPDPVPS